ncbi:MAG: uncharacterized protein K0Q95_3361 [Bacteroidota bacterium]|jgi:uncharacterized protein (TIGR04141 family)|nr:uncharacterized protein [Bacteroidota bacterium]
MSKKEIKPVQKLSIFLLKEDVKNFKDALKEKVSVTEYAIKKNHNIDGLIYVGLEKSHTPDWKRLLQEGTDKKMPPLSSSSTRALLFLRIDKRVFVLTFGYGKHLIKDETIERDFGLKTALNLVDADKLRSMDKANLDNLTVLTRTQTSQQAKQEAFDVDIIRDLLKGITGQLDSGQENLGAFITGNEGVYILPRINFEDISKSLIQLKKAYDSKKYLTNFHWIDNLKAEKDPSVISKVQEKLIESLKGKDSLDVSISPPFLIDWSTFEGISYTPKGDLEQDFNIESFYRIKEDDLADLDWDKLIKIKIHLQTDDKEDRTSLPIWRCLNYQTTIRDNLYVFAFGKWYRVASSYAKQIRDYALQIEESTAVFIDCPSGVDEGEYNIQLASSDVNYSLFDKELVNTDLVRSGIEVCDVLTQKGEFIHVKFRKSSATLSHLFAQGKISASLLMKDRVFRKNFRGKLKGMKLNPDLIPLEYKDLDKSKYTITFAIIETKKRSFVDSLPFFSLLNFRLTAEELQNWGFKVRVKKIVQV